MLCLLENVGYWFWPSVRLREGECFVSLLSHTLLCWMVFISHGYDVCTDGFILICYFITAISATGLNCKSKARPGEALCLFLMFAEKTLSLSSQFMMIIYYDIKVMHSLKLGLKSTSCYICMFGHSLVL